MQTSSRPTWYSRLRCASAVACALAGAAIAQPLPPSTTTVSVVDFGAKGDDEIDDTAALQAAVRDGAASNRRVVVPPGVYLVATVATGGPPGWSHDSHSGGVALPSGTHLSVLPGATLKAIPSGAYAGQILRVDGADHVRVDGGGLLLGDRDKHRYDDPSTPTSPDRRTMEWNYGIKIRGSIDVVIEGLRIHGCVGDGIMIQGQFTGGRLEAPAERIRIVGNQLDGARRNNISVIEGARDVVITQNRITRAGFNDAFASGTMPRAGIDVEGGVLASGTSPVGTIISDNVFLGNWGSAISVYNGRDTTVVGNVADSPIGYGFSATVAIVGNTVREGPQSDPSRFGPFLPGTTYARGDKVRHQGIAYQSRTVGNVGRNPSPTDQTWWRGWSSTGIYGLGLANGMSSNGATIQGNLVQGFDVGIDLRGSDVTAQGNQVLGSRFRGILVYAADRVGVIGNAVSGARVGISVSLGSANVTVADNQIFGATSRGIESAGGQASIRGNTIRRSPASIQIVAGDAVVDSNVILPEGVAGETHQLEFNGPGVDASASGNFIQASKAIHPVLVVNGVRRIRLRGNQVVGILGDSGIHVAGAVRVDVVDNLVTFARETDGGAGVVVTGSTGARLLGNKIYAENDRPLRYAIRTEGATASKVFANAYSKGSFVTGPSDMVGGNTAF